MVSRLEGRCAEMKEYKGKIILTSMMTVMPIVVGLLLWNRLPDTIATHFDSGNVANGWSSKTFTVLGLPFILLAIHLVTVIVSLNDPKRKNIGGKMLTLVFWIIPVISWVMFVSIYAYALELSIDIGVVSGILISVIFLIMGNYMSKNRQNYTVGIKLPWTLNSAENWNRTNRFAGRLWIVAGVVLLMSVFFNQTAVLIGVLIVIGVVPVIYSFILYKKGI